MKKLLAIILGLSLMACSSEKMAYHVYDQNGNWLQVHYVSSSYNVRLKDNKLQHHYRYFSKSEPEWITLATLPEGSSISKIWKN